MSGHVRGEMSNLITCLRLTLRPSAPPSGDIELLTRFLEQHDQDAFTELVRRHGPMVHGVCRRALGDGPDAEDAYQATFLVLARRAEVVRGIGRVSGWLYGVVCLTAKKARIRRAKRRVVHGVLFDVPAPTVSSEPDLGSVIDEELSKVPEKYRTAVVLCELRQQTLDEAAAELGVPRGTVASRLARGRELLGQRLLKRGLFAVGMSATGSVVARPPLDLDWQTVERGTDQSFKHELTAEVLHAMNGSNRRLWYSGLLAVAVAILTGVPLLSPKSHAAPTPRAEVKTAVDRVKLASTGGLLDQPSVRKALELTDEQDAKLKGAAQEITTLLKAFAAQPRGVLARELANEKMNDLYVKYDEKAVEVLTATQLHRLKQIHLQKEGPVALIGRFAVRELKLTPDQEDKIADAVHPLLRAKPFVNLPTKVGARNPQDIEDVDKALGARAEKIDKIRDAAMKHLTGEQKKQWKELTGEPIPTVELVAAATDEFFFRLYMDALK